MSAEKDTIPSHLPAGSASSSNTQPSSPLLLAPSAVHTSAEDNVTPDLTERLGDASSEMLRYHLEYRARVGTRRPYRWMTERPKENNIIICLVSSHASLTEGAGRVAVFQRNRGLNLRRSGSLSGSSSDDESLGEKRHGLDLSDSYSSDDEKDKTPSHLPKDYVKPSDRRARNSGDASCSIDR